jgi:hypothetical protein
VTKAVSLSNGKIRVIDLATCILEITVDLTAALLNSTNRLLPRFDDLRWLRRFHNTVFYPADRVPGGPVEEFSSTWITALAWSPLHICRNRGTPLDPHSALFELIRYPV